MAFDAFLMFQGTTTAETFVPVGESTDSQFQSYNAFEIKSFSFSLQNNVTISSGSRGAGAGKAVFEKFKFQKGIDRGSPTLFSACSAGKHIPIAALVLRKAGGATPGAFQPCYLVFKFLFCYVDTVSWSGSSGDDVPSEDVSFAYGAMQINYKMQGPTGALVGNVFEAAWSQVNNRATFEVTAAGASNLAAVNAKLPPGAVGQN